MNHKKFFLIIFSVVILFSPFPFILAEETGEAADWDSSGDEADWDETSIPNPLDSENFEDLVNSIAGWVYKLGIPVVVIMIIWAGLLFVMSGGDEEKIKKAKKNLLWAVIGLTIILLSTSLTAIIKSIF